MNDLPFEDEDPLAEEITPLEDILGEMKKERDTKEVLYKDDPCLPQQGTLEERILIEKALFGIYSYLCLKCRKRLRGAIISLSLANAKEVIEKLDIKKYIPLREDLD
ncbi:MAG: hypothetical protein ACXABI_05185 [Candidatus Hodarchaeales archaeon]|jgi:hypothetical protein